VIRSDPGLYERLEVRTRKLGEGLVAAADEADIPASWNGVGAMGSLFFTEGPVTDWPSAAAADRDRYGRFFHGMLNRGIYLAPSPFEAWFVSAAHSDDDIERTLTAAREVMETL
jgi:glutamate-1-semialdehyde 2,1-aminomutase